MRSPLLLPALLPSSLKARLNEHDRRKRLRSQLPFVTTLIQIALSSGGNVHGALQSVVASAQPASTHSARAHSARAHSARAQSANRQLVDEQSVNERPVNARQPANRQPDDTYLTVNAQRTSVSSGRRADVATREVLTTELVPIYTSELIDELSIALQHVKQGLRLSEALELMAERTCAEVNVLVSTLCSAERYGSPIGIVLEQLARDAQLDQAHLADRVASRLSVQMLFPLAFFTLPAFALLVVAPMIVSALGALTSMSY